MIEVTDFSRLSFMQLSYYFHDLYKTCPSGLERKQLRLDQHIINTVINVDINFPSLYFMLNNY